MSKECISFDANHKDLIHDAKFDYYGKRLATCSSDRTVKIFEIVDDKHEEICTLGEHEGPVWQVDWAHPTFGCFLASCGYDHKVIIYKETGKKTFEPVYSLVAESSINSVSWAPSELGLCLACASSDCSVIVISFENDKWNKTVIKNAHKIGATSVSWASCSPIGSLTTKFDQPTPLIKRFVSGGCDNLAVVWKHDEGRWQREKVLQKHKDWVRDVAWAPNIGLPYETIATCSQDQSVTIWKRGEKESEWSSTTLKFKKICWKVSWSVTGNILAVTTADNLVSLWKENLDSKQWQQIGKIQEDKNM